MIPQVIMAFFAIVSFSVIFNIPSQELVYCGLTGTAGWLFYRTGITGSPAMQTVIATILVTCIGRILSYRRKMPLIIYLVPGIIPLVPGSGLYYTMYEMLNNQNLAAFSKGIETIKTAGSIAIGTIIVLSLPRKFFAVFAAGGKKI